MIREGLYWPLSESARQLIESQGLDLELIEDNGIAPTEFNGAGSEPSL